MDTHFDRCAIGILLVGLAATAQAASFNNASGLAAPEQTLVFDHPTLGHNDAVTDEFAGFGVRFQNAFFNPDEAAYPSISGGRIGNFRGGISYVEGYAMLFDSPLAEVAFSMVTQPAASSTIGAYLGGVLVESLVVAGPGNSNFTNYYGFTGIVFDEIQISVVSGDRAFLLDNLQTVAAVPEPQTAALMLAGVLSVGALARRRR